MKTESLVSAKHYVFALILSFQIAVYIAEAERIIYLIVFNVEVFDDGSQADDHLVMVIGCNHSREIIFK